jgi:hypothetical protein
VRQRHCPARFAEGRCADRLVDTGMDAPRCPRLAGRAEDCVQVWKPAAGAGRRGIPPRHPESMSPLHQRRDLGLGVLSLAPGMSGIPAIVLTGELLIVSGVPATGAVIAGLLAMRSGAPAVKAFSIAGFVLGVVMLWYVTPAWWWAGRSRRRSNRSSRVVCSPLGPGRCGVRPLPNARRAHRPSARMHHRPTAGWELVSVSAGIERAGEKRTRR